MAQKLEETLIALGSNAFSVVGDAKAAVKHAIAALGAIAAKPLKQSHLYQTPAFPPGAGPPFVNAAVAMATALSPVELLAQLHAIEANAGRTRDKRWGPRTLDIDLIGIGDRVCPDPQTQTWWRDLPEDQQMREAPQQLILPHPRLQDRSFVLMPLADVAPDWVHPIIGQTVTQMLGERPTAERATVVPL